MKKVTTLLIVCVAALLAFGCVMLYSAVAGGETKVFLRQLQWYPLAVAAGIVCASINYHWLRKFAWPIYGSSLVLLVLVFVPGIGVNVNNSARWIEFMGFTFQPSELAKIAMVVVLAYYAEAHARKMREFGRGVLFPGLIVSGFLVLLLAEPDFGSTLLFFAVATCLLLIAGVNVLYFLLPGAAVLGVVVVFLANNPNRMARIEAWKDPYKYRETIGYQTVQSLEALKRGGVSGEGLGDGHLKNYLPESDKDMIFAVVGEELGIAATLPLVVLFILFNFCGFYIAWHARDTFGLILASGLTLFISIQAFIHMGVGTNLLPNKGFPLPFFSAGGSNLLFNMSAVGLLFSVARQGWQKKRKSNPFMNEVEIPFAEMTS